MLSSVVIYFRSNDSLVFFKYIITNITLHINCVKRPPIARRTLYPQRIQVELMRQVACLNGEHGLLINFMLTTLHINAIIISSD